MYENLPLDVVLNETADAYETVASLAPAVDASACTRCNEHGPFREGSTKEQAREVHQQWHALSVNIQLLGGKLTSKAGSRVPPGLSEALDEDEYSRAITAVDDWALYVAHHLLDTVPGIGTVPDSTPSRLRLAARWADRLESETDVMAWYAFQDDARTHLGEMKRLARRGTRRLRTHSPCLDVTCTGQYVIQLGGPKEDGDLVCNRCQDRVPQDQWERWGTRTEWVSVERAMTMLGVATKHAVWSRAKREGWRRRGEGREVRYWAEDVERRVGGSAA